MQREAAGIATERPIMKREAEMRMSVPMQIRRMRYLLTYITPHRCGVQHIRVPDDRVDEVVEAAKASPCHVETCTGIPRFKVPRERDKGDDKSNEGEDLEDQVGSGHFV